MRVLALLVALAGLDCAAEKTALEDREPPIAPVDTALAPALDAPRGAPPLAGSDEPVAPASRYIALPPDACAIELALRAVPHEGLGPTRGVAAPVRLTGPLSGVTFRTLLPEKQRVRSPYEIFDCRLVLALDDFAKLLASQGISEVIHYSAYRPPPPGWSEGPFGRRHEGGLAIDVAYFRTANGLALNVERDFSARPAERPCAAARQPRATPEAIALRKIVCDGVDAGLFHVTLTPDYDRTHHDHFHFELTPGASGSFAR